MFNMHIFLFTGLFLFMIGIWGVFLNRKNILIILMSVEMILLSINLLFVIFSNYLDDFMGQFFSLFILTVAAAESAIGLAILVIIYYVRGTISLEFLSILKG